MSPSTKKRARHSRSRQKHAKPHPAESTSQWDPIYYEDLTFSLDENVKDELAQISGVTDQARRAQLCDTVRRRLSMYPSMVKAIDQAPRATSVSRTLQARLDEANRLARWLLARPDPWSWELTLAGFDFDDDVENLVTALERFVTAGEQVQRGLKQQESRHGPTRHALRVTIQKLSCLFDFYFEGDERDLQKLKAEFVYGALAAAKISTGTFDPLETKAPSRSRFVRELPRICPGCRAAGRGQELAKDLVWERIEALARKRRAKKPKLSPEEAISEVLKTWVGARLYSLYDEVGLKPLDDVRKEPRIGRLLARKRTKKSASPGLARRKRK